MDIKNLIIDKMRTCLTVRTIIVVLIIFSIVIAIDKQRMISYMEKFADLEQSDMPIAVDLKEKFPPIQDQGDYGTCSAFAACYALGAINGVDYSEAFVSSYMVMDSMSTANALQILKSHGVCQEKEYPYTRKNILGRPSKKVRRLARMNKIFDFDYFETNEKMDYRGIVFVCRQTEASPSFVGINKARKLLSEGIPVILRIIMNGNIHYEFENGRIATTAWFEPLYLNESHALCLSGYNDTLKTDDGQGVFIAVNSWGVNPSTGGCVMISYQEVSRQNKKFYVIIADEDRRMAIRKIIK